METPFSSCSISQIWSTVFVQTSGVCFSTLLLQECGVSILASVIPNLWRNSFNIQSWLAAFFMLFDGFVIVLMESYYSWLDLVVPYTEELISRLFVDENWFRLMLLNRMSAKNAIGYFFFHSHPLLFHLPQSPTVSSAPWVILNGFVPKRPIWISHQRNFAFLL